MNCPGENDLNKHRVKLVPLLYHHKLIKAQNRRSCRGAVCMTTMGNIDKGATKLLNSLSNRDPLKVRKLKDLISVQHAKWIAVRLRRCMGFHNRSIEESARRMYLQPPKGRRHDRSSQGSRGEFARLSTVLCQQEDTRISGATAGARRGKGPAPKRCGPYPAVGCNARNLRTNLNSAVTA